MASDFPKPPRIPGVSAQGRPVVQERYAWFDTRYAPVRVNRLAGAAGGLDVTRPDTPVIPFSDVVLVSVFREAGAPPPGLRVLFFVRERTRPFLADTGLADFTGFPGVVGTSMAWTVRNLVRLVRERNPETLVDEHTHAFALGGPPPDFEAGRYVATALGVHVFESGAVSRDIWGAARYPMAGERVRTCGVWERDTTGISAEEREEAPGWEENGFTDISSGVFEDAAEDGFYREEGDAESASPGAGNARLNGWTAAGYAVYLIVILCFLFLGGWI
jgi:hypothetical protein